MLQDKQNATADYDAPFRARLKARDGVRPQSTLAILAGYDPRQVENDAASVSRSRPEAGFPVHERPVRERPETIIEIPPPVKPSLPTLARGPMVPAVRPGRELAILDEPAPQVAESGEDGWFRLGRHVPQKVFIGLAALGLAGLSFLAADNALKDRTEPQPRDDDNTDVMSAAARGEGGSVQSSVSAVAVQDVATPMGIEPSPWFDYRGVADYLTARVSAFEAVEKQAVRLQEMEAERMAAAALADAEAQRLAATARAIAEEEAGRLAAETARRERLAQEEALRIANAEAARLAAQAEADAVSQAEADRLARAEAERAAAALVAQHRDAELEAARMAQAEASRQAAEESRRLAAEAEARRLAEIEAHRAAAQAEEQQMAQLAAQRAAEEEAARLAALRAEEEVRAAEARRLAELEAQRLAELEARRATEAEQIRLAELAAARAVEEEASRQAAEEQRLAALRAQQAEEEQAARLAALQARQAEEAEATRLAELAATRRAEEEAARLAAEEIRMAEIAAQREAAEKLAEQTRAQQQLEAEMAQVNVEEAPAITLASAVLVSPSAVAEPDMPPSAASLKPVRPRISVQPPAMSDTPVARGAPKMLNARQPEVRSFANADQLRSADVFVADRVQRTARQQIEEEAIAAFQADFVRLVNESVDGSHHEMTTPDGRLITLRFEETRTVDAAHVQVRAVSYGATPEGAITRGYDTPPQVTVSVMCRDVSYALPGQERGRFSACQTVDGGWLMARPAARS